MLENIKSENELKESFLCWKSIEFKLFLFPALYPALYPAYL